MKPHGSSLLVTIWSLVLFPSVYTTWAFGHYKDEDGAALFGPHFSDKADCAKDNVINTFLEYGLICHNDPIWNGRFKENSATITQDLGKDKWAVLFLYIIKHVGSIEKEMFDRHLGNPNTLETIVTSLSDDALINLSRSEIVELRPKIIRFMTQKQTQIVDDKFIVDAINNGESAKDLRMTLNSLHSNVIASNLGIISAKVTKTSALKLWKLSDHVLKPLLADDNFCKDVSPAQMLTLGERKEKAKLVTPSCFAAMEWKDDASCDRRIRYFPETILKCMDGLPNSCIKLMTETLVKHHGTGLDDKERCSNLAVENLPFSAITGVDPGCLSNRFANGGASNVIALGAAWTVLSEKALSKFPDNEETIEHISPNDFQYISVKQKAALVTSADTCPRIPPQFFYFRGNVDITKECFEKLRDEVKGPALLYAKLPDTALSTVTSFEGWEVPIKALDSDLVKGLDILNHAGHVRNIAKLIENLSSADPGSHACRDIKTLEEFKKMPILQRYCTKKCVESIGEKPNITNIGGLSRRVVGMIPTSELIADIEDKDWRQFDDQLFESLVANASFCKSITADQWNYLDDKCIGKVDSKCAAEITVWDKLDDRIIKAMDPKAFRLITVEVAANITMSKLDDEQFGKLGLDVAPEKNPATTWNKDFMASLTTLRIKAIEANTWRACNADAYAGLSVDHIKAISPTMMTEMNAKQVANIPQDSVKVLSEEQAREIGKSHTSLEESPLKVLEKMPLGEKPKEIIKARLAIMEKPINQPAAGEEAKTPINKPAAGEEPKQLGEPEKPAEPAKPVNPEQLGPEKKA